MFNLMKIRLAGLVEGMDEKVMHVGYCWERQKERDY
jgi:hypothetical protein